MKDDAACLLACLLTEAPTSWLKALAETIVAMRAQTAEEKQIMLMKGLKLVYDARMVPKRRV